MQTYLDLLCFILLCFTDAAFCLFLTNGWLEAIPLFNKSFGTFPAAFGDVVSLCYVLIILTIFQHFFIVVILTMVICDR